MKIVTVVGARPQFVKAAAFSRALAGKHEEIIVHTGQHFDANMSDIFFEQLKIPRPHYNLGISGGTHGKMTGSMLAAIEDVLLHVGGVYRIGYWCTAILTLPWRRRLPQ